MGRRSKRVGQSHTAEVVYRCSGHAQNKERKAVDIILSMADRLERMA